MMTSHLQLHVHEPDNTSIQDHTTSTEQGLRCERLRFHYLLRSRRHSVTRELASW